MRSWQHLAKALKQRSLDELSGQDRARTAARIGQLRSSQHPSRLLIDWRPSRAPHDVYLDSLVAHAERGDDAYVKRALTRPAEYLRNGHDLAQVVSSERIIRGESRQQLAAAAVVSEGLVRAIELGRPLSSPG